MARGSLRCPSQRTQGGPCLQPRAPWEGFPNCKPRRLSAHFTVTCNNSPFDGVDVTLSNGYHDEPCGPSCVGTPFRETTLKWSGGAGTIAPPAKTTTPVAERRPSLFPNFFVVPPVALDASCRREFRFIDQYLTFETLIPSDVRYGLW